MLPLGLFLHLLVLGASGDLTIGRYEIDSQTDSLPSSPSMEIPSADLNAAEPDNRHIDKGVFEGAASMKILNPADNFLDVLPQSVISNLKNLDLPSRTGNGTVESATRSYADVRNLESPEDTDNPVESSRASTIDRPGESIDNSIPETTDNIPIDYNPPLGIELVYLFHHIAPLVRVFNFRVSLPGSVKVI